MASIYSIISIFIVLLATYCYASPIRTEDSLIKRESLPLTLSVRERTIKSESDVKRSIEDDIDEPKNDNRRLEVIDDVVTEESIKHDHDDKKRTTIEESKVDEEREVVDEVVTEDSIKHDHDDKKRTTIEESKDHLKREVVDDVVTEDSIKHDHDDKKRTTIEESKVDEEREVVDDVVTEDSIKHDHDDKKRTTIEESKADIKREDDDVVTEESIKKDFEDKKRTIEKSKADLKREVIDEVVTEGSKVEREMESELSTKFESSTEFDRRAVRFMDGEPITVSEPTSSFETLARSTGLLDKPLVDDKVEGTFEKDVTMPKSDN